MTVKKHQGLRSVESNGVELFRATVKLFHCEGAERLAKSRVSQREEVGYCKYIEKSKKKIKRKEVKKKIKTKEEDFHF